MLEKLQQIASRMAPVRVPALVLAGLTLPVLAWIITTSDSAAQDKSLIPVLIIFIWLLFLFSFLSLFRQIPQRIEPGGPLLMRLRRAVRRFAYTLVAFFMVLTSLALLLTSLRLAGAWLRMY